VLPKFLFTPTIMVSGYLRNLREKVGHDLLLLPSVTVLVFDELKRVLLVRHVDRNVWVAPGGMVEVDESPTQAARREMLEETGCEVEISRILGVYGGPAFRIRYRNGDEVAYVMTVFEASIIAGQARPDGQETLEINFFSYTEVQQLATGNWLLTVLEDALASGAFQ
jgi:ADP-ribose pyrophosphatase YjhB (NUDIX family)